MNEQEEVVYKLIPPEKTEPVKPPRYTSKFRYPLRDLKGKGSHKTMGYASVPLHRPSSFLQKHSRKLPRPKIEAQHCLLKAKRPDVPSHYIKVKKENFNEGKEMENLDGNKENPNLMDLNLAKSSNYFRLKNIINVIHAKPPPRECRIIDTCRGDRQVLMYSGLAPHYLHKKDYGRLPKYLLKIRQEEGKKMAIGKKTVEQRQSVMCIEGETRKKLLEGLKEDWIQLQSSFQKLPMMIDTIPKIKRKLALEKELNRLERDIAVIEKHPVIILCDPTP